MFVCFRIPYGRKDKISPLRSLSLSPVEMTKKGAGSLRAFSPSPFHFDERSPSLSTVISSERSPSLSTVISSERSLSPLLSFRASEAYPLYCHFKRAKPIPLHCHFERAQRVEKSHGFSIWIEKSRLIYATIVRFSVYEKRECEFRIPFSIRQRFIKRATSPTAYTPAPRVPDSACKAPWNPRRTISSF